MFVSDLSVIDQEFPSAVRLKNFDAAVERCDAAMGLGEGQSLLEDLLECGGGGGGRGSLPARVRRRRDGRDEGSEDLPGFESLLADLAAQFGVASSDQVADSIAAAQEQICRRLGLDYCALFSRAEPGSRLVETHAWPSAPAWVQAGDGVGIEADFPWAAAQVLEGRMVRFSQAANPSNDCASPGDPSRQSRVKSGVVFPLSMGGRVVGAVAFGTIRREERWSESLVERLRIVSDALAGLVARGQGEVDRRQLQGEVQRLRDQLRLESLQLRQEIKVERRYERIIGKSVAIGRVMSQAEQVAATESTVLLTGDTGTGKELVAQAIHDLSSRRGRAMVKVNCAALPAGLVESELFGRERGAYTGALTREIGRFELAHQSTIFLDELAELPLELQAKLLRVLQEGEFERVGNPKPIRVNVRVIAATNKDLKKAVAEGRFREDLFYRLAVFPIEVPPLRDRVEDIPMMVWAFVGEFGNSMGKTIEAIPQASMAALQRHDWPGNVRELRNVIERAMIVSSGPTLQIAVPETPVAPPAHGHSRNLRELEKRHILEVLQQTGWRVRGAGRAAELLGLKPTTLEARMAKLGIGRARAKS